MKKLMNIKKLILVLSVLFSVVARAEEDDEISREITRGKIKAAEAANKAESRANDKANEKMTIKKSADKNDKNPDGAQVLAVGATSSTDSCLCNTVGGTIGQAKDKSRYDHLLEAENPKSGKDSSPSQGAGAVDGN